MITRIALALLLALASTQTALAQIPPSVERLIPGSSMVLNSKTLDVFGAVYAPGLNAQTGNYSVKYTASANPHNATDDFSTLDCGAGNAIPVTYTLPTIATNVFPSGHGVGFVNTSTNLLCTITANVSAITGAPGVTNGNPAATGGPITLFPNGQVWLQSDGAGYKARDFVPGVWYQFANNVAALQWTGLSGYPEMDLHCSGILPATSGDSLVLQESYAGTYQAAGYNSIAYVLNQGVGTIAVQSNTATTYFQLTGAINNPGTGANGAGAVVLAHLTFANGTGAGYANRIISFDSTYSANSSSEASYNNEGAAPYTTNADPVDKIQIFMAGASNITQGMCWLRPSL